MARRGRRETVAVARGAGRSFGRRVAVSGVDVTLKAGDVLGIVGPNGGGKSTLLLLMAGLLRPTTGTVTVCDIAAHELALTSAGLVGLVTARPGLYPLLTGRENLRHFGGLYGLSRDEVTGRAEPLLASLDLVEGLDERVGRWSTGMQQKLSLVRALLLSPRLLLFDEPTANLDPVASAALYDELRARADGGLACVLVTHDLAAAEAVCDRVLLLDVEVKKTLTLASRSAQPTGPLFEAWREEIDAR